MKHKTVIVTASVAAGLAAVGLASAFARAAAQPPRHEHAPASAAMPGQMPGMNMGQPASAPAPATAPATTMAPGYAEITVAPPIQQRIGVTVGHVESAPLEMTVRAVGIVRPDETRVAHIHIRTDGWVEKLFIDFTGQTVAAGDPLLTIYSPQFLIAQDEYLSALRAAPGRPSGSTGPQLLIEAARRKLELWGVPADEIAAVEKSGRAMTTLTLRSGIAGTVLDKKVFPGQYVTPQDDLLLVADLSTVWVQAKLYEYELPHVQTGQPATITLPDLPLREFPGRVAFVAPTVDEASRTADVRIELPNPDGLLKPGMFSYAVLTHAMGTGLLVPDSAVIRTGQRDIAFRVAPENRFVPVEVKISPLKFGPYFQVLEGLEAGDAVVTSANFLIDSESRLQIGAASMAGMPGMEMGSTPATKTPPGQPHKAASAPATQPAQMPGMDMPGRDHSPAQP